MTDTVRLADVRAIPDMSIDEPSVNGSHPAADLLVVPLEQFTTTEEDVPDPLLGQPDDTLLPSDGLLLMYGDGGAGKTTISIDAMAHLASGTPWLGLHVPRPLRILLMENEGPRAPFRIRLQNKVAAWQGEPFAQNVHVLEEPWTRFTLTDNGYREQLAQQITGLNIDLVIVGPLASLGAKGTGTPDEINEFAHLVTDLRQRAHTRSFALWIVHHENKAGDVSGAWERYPDTLVHVQAQGNGRTRIHWRKVRWSSALHGTSSNLVWSDGNGFTVEEKKERDLQAEILEKSTAPNDYAGWRTAPEIARLVKANVDRVKEALSELVEQGQMHYLKGPSGRKSHARCWKLATNPEAPSQFESVAPLEGFPRPTDSLTPPMKESESESVESEAAETNPTDPSQLGKDDDEVARIVQLYGDDER